MCGADVVARQVSRRADRIQSANADARDERGTAMRREDGTTRPRPWWSLVMVLVRCGDARDIPQSGGGKQRARAKARGRGANSTDGPSHVRNALWLTMRPCRTMNQTVVTSPASRGVLEQAEHHCRRARGDQRPHGSPIRP